MIPRRNQQGNRKLCACILKAPLSLATAIADRRFLHEYVYVKHDGKTVAIDERLWPRHQLSPTNRPKR